MKTPTGKPRDNDSTENEVLQQFRTLFLGDYASRESAFTFLQSKNIDASEPWVQDIVIDEIEKGFKWPNNVLSLFKKYNVDPKSDRFKKILLDRVKDYTTGTWNYSMSGMENNISFLEENFELDIASSEFIKLLEDYVLSLLEKGNQFEAFQFVKKYNLPCTSSKLVDYLGEHLEKISNWSVDDLIKTTELLGLNPNSPNLLQVFKKCVFDRVEDYRTFDGAKLVQKLKLKFKWTKTDYEQLFEKGIGGKTEKVIFESSGADFSQVSNQVKCKYLKSMCRDLDFSDDKERFESIQSFVSDYNLEKDGQLFQETVLYAIEKIFISQYMNISERTSAIVDFLKACKVDMRIDFVVECIFSLLDKYVVDVIDHQTIFRSQGSVDYGQTGKNLEEFKNFLLQFELDFSNPRMRAILEKYILLSYKKIPYYTGYNSDQQKMFALAESLGFDEKDRLGLFFKGYCSCSNEDVKKLLEQYANQNTLLEKFPNLEKSSSKIIQETKSKCSDIKSSVGEKLFNDLLEKLGVEIKTDFDYYVFSEVFVWLGDAVNLPKDKLPEEEFTQHFSKIRSSESYNKFKQDLNNYDPEKANEVKVWIRKAVEFLGQNIINVFCKKLNFTLDSSFDFYKAHDYFLWVEEIAKANKPTAQEISQILSNIDNKTDLDKFTNLLRSYDRAEDDFWNSQNQPVISLRELEKRVNFMKNKLDFKHIPEKHRSKMDVLVNAPGFDPEAFKTLSREKRFVNLLEGKYPNWIEPRVQSYYQDIEQSLLEIFKYKAPSNLKELKANKGKGDKVFDAEISAIELKVSRQRFIYAKMKAIVLAEGILKETDIDFKEKLGVAIANILKKIPLKYNDLLAKECKAKNIDIGNEYIATIHDKADPEGWVVGNWTDCCMPFGAANNTDYMYNSCTQYFSVKVKSKNGKERIIAQSVLVDGNNTETNEDLIILDNIEVANSHKNKSDELSYVYNRFWSENRNGKDVRIGAGYLDLIPLGATLVPNTIQPKKTLEYSDAGGPQIYNLPKMEDFGNKNEPVFANLTERDVKIISELEAEIYSDNKGLRLGDRRVKEVIEAQREMQVPGAASSFVARINNKPIGYLLVLPEKSGVNSGQIVAHVQDLAIKEEHRKGLLSLKMLNRVFDAVKAYNLPAIEVDARENTSFKALRSPIVRRFIQEKGFKLKFYDSSFKEVDYKNAESNPNLEMGGENFYFVRIENENYDKNRQVDFQQINHNEVAEQYHQGVTEDEQFEQEGDQDQVPENLPIEDNESNPSSDELGYEDSEAEGLYQEIERSIYGQRY